MSNVVAARPANQTRPSAPSEIMEQVLIRGDVSKLTPEERSHYYMKVCESVGLNPLTQPFAYITLNGKLVLYAQKGCTDQLRSIYDVSVEDLVESERDGVFIVTAKVRNGKGRTDVAKGAVTIGGLKGDALANAMMKAETKAKRRATLSICGLGVLDETEIETIPSAAIGGEVKPLPKKNARDVYEKLQAEIRQAQTHEGLRLWGEQAKERIAVLPLDWADILRSLYHERLVELRQLGAAPAIGYTKPDEASGLSTWLEGLEAAMAGAGSADEMAATWDQHVGPVFDRLSQEDQETAAGILRRHEARVSP